MKNYALLNNVDHQDMRVITDHSAELGDDLMYAVTFPAEFRNVQAHYPILFFADQNNEEIYPVALFGFQQKENLFLTDRGWDASYIPASVQREPFLIGTQKKKDDPNGEHQRMVSIDTQSPKLSTERGERLFEPLGGTTPYLERMANLLESMHEGYAHGIDFVRALQAYELLETVTLEIELKDGSQNQLLGFQTVNEDKLKDLAGETLKMFSEKGFLAPLFMVIASMASMEKLVDRKNLSLD